MAQQPDSTYSRALAEEKEKDAPKAEETEEGSDEKASDMKPASSLNDPLQPRFNKAELKVLQNLSQRRQEIEAREKKLEERIRFAEAAEQRLEKKYGELTALKQELTELLGTQQEAQEGRVKKLVKIYETMKPKDAANIFNELDFNVLIQIIEKMSERKIAPIIAAMNPARARNLSARLAEQKALPDPNDL